MRAGSLSGAAKAAGMTHATVRRHLEDMERTLGVVLFTRSSEGLTPTAAALKLEAAAAAMESAAETLMRAASAEAGSTAGVVKIVCGEIMAQEVLPPLVAGLRARNPGLQLELAVNNSPMDILHGTADIAIQMSRPPQKELVAQLLGTLDVGLFAHARYLANAGAPLTVADLGAFSLIGADDGSSGFMVLRSHGIAIDPRRFVLRAQSQGLQLSAIRAGAGIGAIQAPLASRDPALVRVLPEINHRMEAWLVMHEDLLDDRRVMLVYEAMARHLSAYAREESGARPDESPEWPMPATNAPGL
jgi:DNA-binding transcriptional LysR family regulator